jgi:hypothetical protein
MFNEQIKWHSADFSGMFTTMWSAFWATTKTIISGIPVWVLVIVGLMFLGMGVWQFLKDLKVV